MKQEDTRQKILAKALELFSVHGYDAVSVGQIAAAVGIKAPSLYNHFPSKRAIFDAIVEATAAQYEADTDRIDMLLSFSASPHTEQVLSQVLSARFSVHSPKL